MFNNMHIIISYDWYDGCSVGVCFAGVGGAVPPLERGQPTRKFKMYRLQKNMLVFRVPSWDEV